MPFARFHNLDPERQRAILRAASEEFAESGFEAASYNRIIERAEISKGAMYYYFADKDDLYRTVLAEAVEGWIAHAGPLPAVQDADEFWQACRAMHRAMLAFLADAPVEAALCFRIANVRARGGHAHPALEEVNRRTERFFAGLVVAGQRLGAVRDDLEPALLVQMAMGLVDGIDRYLIATYGGLDLAKSEQWVELTVGALERLTRPGWSE